MGTTNVTADSSAAYKSLLEEYKAMQTTAYTSQSVTKDQLSSLKTKLDSYIDTHVSDATKKDAAKASLTSDFSAMEDSITLQTTEGKKSNKEWDSAREDMQILLQDLAPEGVEDEVYDPTASKAAGGLHTMNLSVKSAGSVDASGADMTGVDDYMSQHPEAAPYLDMVKQASVKYQPATPVRVLLAQINAESSFNPNAQGARGEQGLTQFTRETWSAFGEGDYSNASDPQTAINAQAKYMAQLQSENGGNLAYALESYNGWERDKSYDYNVSKGCSPTYVQDATGESYDQRNDSTG